MRDRIYGIPLTDVGARVNAIVDKCMDDLWHALDAEFECPNDSADNIWKAAREAARKAIMHEFADGVLMDSEAEHGIDPSEFVTGAA